MAIQKFDSARGKTKSRGLEDRVPDGVDPLGVAAPGVDPALGQVGLLHLRPLLPGGLHPGPAHAVMLLLAVEHRLLRDLGLALALALALLTNIVVRHEPTEPGAV